jgi:hypothetical protein
VIRTSQFSATHLDSHKFTPLTNMLSEKCYAALAGTPFDDGADSGDFESGCSVPACHDGKGTQTEVPAAEWSAEETQPRLPLKFKTASELVVTEALKKGGKQIPCIPDLHDANVQRAGFAYALKSATYPMYQYAAAICQTAAFSDLMHAVFADEAATDCHRWGYQG